MPIELLDKARLFDGADVTLMRREDRWWMIMGELADPAVPRIDLRAAHLLRGATADRTEWTIVGQCAAPAPADGWDATGYHCVSYVRGRSGGRWVERLYYASSAAWTDITGPYSIGFLEWDGSQWVRHPEPVFTATEPWERGTVAEPNLLHHDGRWLLWYCAGLSTDGTQVIGFAESPDGVTGWTGRRIFAADGEFDALVVASGTGFDLVTAKHPLVAAPGPDDGVWWARSGTLGQWPAPVRLVSTTDGTSWHRDGVWKPSLVREGDSLVVFFNGSRREGRSPGLSVGRVHYRLR
ncbi:hypothetical protein JOF41_004229 [Saccharothrix coeruleofusca]|uniref:hypothetical protein n=1 Tax=Saccharothrix coeruleofusca TaxID=33919 RepID=UPI001AE4E10B|nr:hypothetical protein [Saccharothrix coeruleofusca]MBP2338051.1 hypothetical protein [Saccharothrix coeruleofusca]